MAPSPFSIRTDASDKGHIRVLPDQLDDPTTLQTPAHAVHWTKVSVDSSLNSICPSITSLNNSILPRHSRLPSVGRLL